MRASLTAAALLFCSAFPSSAVELKGESFFIDRKVYLVGGGYQLLSPSVSSMLYETKNGDIAVTYTSVRLPSPKGRRTSRLYFKLLNADGSRKWRQAVVGRGTYDFYPVGVVDLADGGFAVAYTNETKQFFIQKIINGARVGEPTLVVAKPSDTERRVSGTLFPTSSGGRLIWNTYFNYSWQNKTRTAVIDDQGNVSSVSKAVSGGPRRPIQIVPNANGFQISYRRPVKKEAKTSAYSFSVQEFDQDAAPVGEKNNFYRACKQCPTPSMLTLDGGNQLAITRESPSGRTSFFAEIRDVHGNIVAPRTKIAEGLGTERIRALPGGDFLVVYKTAPAVTNPRSDYNIKILNQSLQQVGSVARVEAGGIFDILPLKAGGVLMAYFYPTTLNHHGALMGQFLNP